LVREPGTKAGNKNHFLMIFNSLFTMFYEHRVLSFKRYAYLYP